MTKAKVPRILIGATGSGCGKTTLVCGILKALQNRGMSLASLKCGPDYIDPMFHKEVLGIS
ncbi:MAG: cobyrinic acid a,c-diamide synthase, partial [Anaerovorax sp.]